MYSPHFIIGPKTVCSIEELLAALEEHPIPTREQLVARFYNRNPRRHHFIQNFYRFVKYFRARPIPIYNNTIGTSPDPTWGDEVTNPLTCIVEYNRGIKEHFQDLRIRMQNASGTDTLVIHSEFSHQMCNCDMSVDVTTTPVTNTDDSYVLNLLQNYNDDSDT